MAKRVRPTMLRAIIGDEASEKMGNYTESTGGGTPLKKGEKLKDHPEAKRVQQPRDENGQFTYNSVNFKERKYDYHGKGDTIPPFLRGVNFSCFVKKEGEINYNGLIYLAGINMSAAEIIERLRTYSGEDGFGKKLNTELKGKRGRRSNITKQKIAEGKEGILDDRALPYLGKITAGEFVGKLEKAWKKAKDNNKKINKKVFKKKPVNTVNTQNDVKNTSDSNNSINSTQNNNFVSNIKKDPKKFVEENYNEIKEISTMLDNAPVSKIVSLLASGKFGSIKELKEKIKKN